MTPTDPVPKQFTLRFDDVSCIDHHNILHVYKELLVPLHNKSHSMKHYHLYTIKPFLQFGTVWGTPQTLWADQCTVQGMIDYALWIYLYYFLNSSMSLYIPYNEKIIFNELQQFIYRRKPSNYAYLPNWRWHIIMTHLFIIDYACVLI